MWRFGWKLKNSPRSEVSADSFFIFQLYETNEKLESYSPSLYSITSGESDYKVSVVLKLSSIQGGSKGCTKVNKVVSVVKPHEAYRITSVMLLWLLSFIYLQAVGFHRRSWNASPSGLGRYGMTECIYFYSKELLNKINECILDNGMFLDPHRDEE